MMRNLKTTILVLLFFVPMILLADGAKTLFDRANDAYEKENYDSTIALLDSLLNVGLESPELYYNLGNAWFKKSEIPRAILYYEKAHKLDPNNPDISYNLELANTRIADKIEPIPEFFLKTWWKNSVQLFTERQWTFINITSYIILLFFVVLFFISHSKSRKQMAFFMGIVFLVISLLTGLLGYQSYKNIHTHNTAIVFTPTINVKSSPNENANTIFVIHQGTKVALIDHLKDWYRIKLANGSVGWLKENDFEKI
jgi:tetratricopeptide (TPR) repeat protein